MKRFILLLSACILFFTGTSLHAQSHMPSNQFGVGLYADPGGEKVDLPGGISLTYAVAHNIHIGSNIALQVVSGGSSFALAPFARYLFSGPVNPYAQGSLAILSQGGTTDLGMVFGGGLAYGVSQNFFTNFNLDLLSFIFTHGGSVGFSFSNVTVGASWFF
jgi:hypothetical protein